MKETMSPFLVGFCQGCYEAMTSWKVYAFCIPCGMVIGAFIERFIK